MSKAYATFDTSLSPGPVERFVAVHTIMALVAEKAGIAANAENGLPEQDVMEVSFAVASTETQQKFSVLLDEMSRCARQCVPALMADASTQQTDRSVAAARLFRELSAMAKKLLDLIGLR